MDLRRRDAKTIDAYTDGASSPDGRGGWSWWINDEVNESGGAYMTTNQRMEMMGALKAMQHFRFHYLEAVESGEVKLRIISDSAYVVNCFQQRWYVRWNETNWKNGKVKNQDLWEQLFSAYESLSQQVEFVHVRGHRGIPGNEAADRLAVKAKNKLLEQK